MAEGEPQIFVVPPLDGAPTGGTIFNRLLLESLGTLSVEAKRCALDAVSSAEQSNQTAFYWLDTLYLEHARALRLVVSRQSRLGLVVHYLPSLLEGSGPLTWERLSADEQFALDNFDAFLVTSRFMRETLERLGVPQRRVGVIEPGRFATRQLPAPCDLPAVRAVMVAHLLPNKGVLPFLQQLASRMLDPDRFELHLVGSPELDAPYALECQRCVDADRKLKACVRLHATLGPRDVVNLMSECNLLVSASTMESYGMALAEARTLGLPVLARAGGNIATMVEAQAGGELLDSVEQLALSFLRLSRSPSELLARRAAAIAHRLSPRPWAAAASEFMAWVYDQKNERAKETDTSNSPNAAAHTPR